MKAISALIHSSRSRLLGQMTNLLMPFFARSDKVAGVVTFEANVPDGEIVARAPGLEKKDKMSQDH